MGLQAFLDDSYRAPFAVCAAVVVNAARQAEAVRCCSCSVGWCAVRNAGGVIGGTIAKSDGLPVAQCLRPVLALEGVLLFDELLGQVSRDSALGYNRATYGRRAIRYRTDERSRRRA